MIIEKIIVKGVTAELAELLREEKQKFIPRDPALHQPSFDFLNGYERAIIDMEYLCKRIYENKK